MQIRWNVTRLLFATLVPVLIAGCAHVPDDHGVEEVRGLVQERAGRDVSWTPDDSLDVDEMVAVLLDEPLTADTATQIALLKNPDVTAAFAELGIRRGDLIEAGTLPNPTLFGMARFVTGSGSGTNAEIDAAFPLLEALMVPLRRKIESQHFESAKLRAAERLLALVADVRAAYYAAFGAQHERELVALTREAAGAAAELARRQFEAGNLSRLERVSHEAFDATTRLDARRLESEALEKEQRLRRLMGLRPGAPQMYWPMRYPEPAVGAVDAAVLEETAVAQRLDLAAAVHEVEAMEFALKLAKRFRYTGMLDVGASGEREPDGEWVVGPTLEIEVPIFDRRRGDVMRTQSMLDLSRAERDALELDIRTEVQSAAARLAESRYRLETYTRDLLPLRAALVEEAQFHYNGMLIGVYDLLRAKQDELETRRGAIESQRDYWIAQVEMERLIAGPLPEGSEERAESDVPAAEEPAATGAGSHEHEHHHEE